MDELVKALKGKKSIIITFLHLRCRRLISLLVFGVISVFYEVMKKR